MNEVFWNNAKEVSKEKKVKELEDKIEWHLKTMNASIEGSTTHRISKELIVGYALQYKKLTGDYYRRNWEE